MNEQDHYPAQDQDQDDDAPQTLDEIRRQQDDHPEDHAREMAESEEIRYPTWRFAEDGRSQIVNSPQELEELEKDGRDWQPTPHEAPVDLPANDLRIFAAPIGTVQPNGHPARPDQPIVDEGPIRDPRPPIPSQDLPRPSRPEHPDHELPGDRPDRPEQGLPGDRLDRPDQGLPGGRFDRPSHGVPGDRPNRPDQGLPETPDPKRGDDDRFDRPDRPSQDRPRPDQELPGRQRPQPKPAPHKTGGKKK